MPDPLKLNDLVGMAMGGLLTKSVWLVNKFTDKLCGEDNLAAKAKKATEAEEELGRLARLVAAASFVPAPIKVRVTWPGVSWSPMGRVLNVMREEGRCGWPLPRWAPLLMFCEPITPGLL